MKKHEFVNERSGRWTRLTGLLDKLEHGSPAKMDEHELDEVVYLYRIACSDLARARAEDFGDDLIGYLNVLIARGYKHFHRPKPPSIEKFVRFFTTDFPQTVRDLRRYVIVALLLFVLPIVLVIPLVVQNPARAYLLGGPEELESLTRSYAQGHQGGRSEDADAMMTGFYINNNIGIAFKCFATGVFWGLGSIFFLVFNGAAIGAVAAYICVAGYSQSFLSFVVGHGAFELTAIVFSGATGLKMGMLFVNPGRYSRLDALKKNANQLIQMILGSAAMLFIAAFIEGFWSPSGAPPFVKFIVGGILWTLVIAYFLVAGRQRSKKPMGRSTMDDEELA